MTSPFTESGLIDAALLIAQVSDYAIIALDPDGTIESWNSGAEQLQGYRAEQALGRNFAMFYTEEDRAEGLPVTLLARALADGSVRHSGWRVRRDGTRFWGDVLVTALYDSDGVFIGFAKVTHDLTERHALQESLERSEQRFRLLVEQVRDYAIICLDPGGTIETWNAGAEQVKGYRPDEAIGQHFSIFYTGADREDELPQRLLAQARRDGRVEHTGWRVRKDGTTFWGDVIITALHDDDSSLRGFVKVTRDLTAKKRFEEARATFLDTFAHDFRTPVTAIAGYAELLTDATGDEQAACLARIQLNAQRLTEMTAELIDHSHLRSHAPPLELVAVPLAELVAQTVSGLSHPSATTRVRTAIPTIEVLADPIALQRVLANLIGNALAYSPDGSPVVVRAAERDDRAYIIVIDEGRGIHPADLPHIFDEFQRGRLASDDGGTGLGLTSVKLLVERMGGAVSIESHLGSGTTITFELLRA